MPSGAKKRKAFKKKKETQVKAASIVHGEEDLKQKISNSKDKSNDSLVDGTPSSNVGTDCIVDESPVLGEEVQVTKSTFNDNNMASYAVLSGLMMGNGEAKVCAVNESFTISRDLMGDELGKEDDEAIQTSHDNAIEDSDAKRFVTRENGYNKLNVSSGAPKVDPVQDFEASECSDNQPRMMGSSLQPIQTSSWKCCCGLLEVFAGSSSR